MQHEVRGAGHDLSTVRSLEKGKGTAFSSSLLEKQKNDSISSLDGISDSEAGTSDGDTTGGISSSYLADASEQPVAKRAKSDSRDTSERAVGHKSTVRV